MTPVTPAPRPRNEAAIARLESALASARCPVPGCGAGWAPRTRRSLSGIARLRARCTAGHHVDAFLARGRLQLSLVAAGLQSLAEPSSAARALAQRLEEGERRGRRLEAEVARLDGRCDRQGGWLVVALVAAALALLVAAGTAGAQPYDAVGPALFAAGCQTAGRCWEEPTPTRPDETVSLCQIGRFAPASSPFHPSSRLGWEARYGTPWGALGDHAAGIGVIQDLARRPDNPLKLRQPYQWTEIDRADAAVAVFGAQPFARRYWRDVTSCHRALADRFNPSCPASWNCTPPTPEIDEGCRTGALRCSGALYPVPLCWQRTPTGRVYYSTTRSECVPGSTVVEPPPPPPPPPPACGDGRVDPGEGCGTCPPGTLECPVPPPPPPPPTDCAPWEDLLELLRELAAPACGEVFRPSTASTGRLEVLVDQVAAR